VRHRVLGRGLRHPGHRAVFEVDPNTVLQEFVEAAEQLQAFSRHTLHDVRVKHVQLDELYTLRSAVKVMRAARPRPSDIWSVRPSGSGW